MASFRLNPFILRQIFLLLLFCSTNIFSQGEWLETESEHFKVIYRDSHAHLVPKIINSAENALKPLMEIFHYTPSEKIIINTYDASDFGFGAATTVPQNFIRLEIEPFETGYETIPFNDRIQWTINHELVHIVVNDHASDIESFFRSLFRKVPPEQVHPISVLYSLLTNLSRFTPRWHQEGIAVFIETWFSGGYGRMLGNFDEMFFRSMVLDSMEFPTHLSLDTKTTHNNFLLETNFYLYGTRFCSYLVYKYGPDKLIDWFTAHPDDFYDSFITKFEKVYQSDFDDEWDNFIKSEKEFQYGNIERLKKSPVTPVRYFSDKIIGWVTEPFFVKSDSSMIFSYHTPHHLAGIQLFNLNNSESTEIATLPTPSLQQVASAAYDSVSNLFFYTTNNNQLFRDIWVIDLNTRDSKMLFKDCRVGDLTVSPVTHDLWGVQHAEGKTTLIYSAYPYYSIAPLINFGVGDDISQLASDPAGKYFSAVLHRSNGEQNLILVNCDSLKKWKGFKYQTITGSGSPENPSWSSDGKYIFWNAYINGVSNIYKISLETFEIEAVSHTLRGLFKPVCLGADSLFAFEFTSEGFRPVVIPNKPADHLPAIEYFGQKIADKYPSLSDWALAPVSDKTYDTELISSGIKYSGLANLKLQALMPLISGFQTQKVFELTARIYDPLFIHDFTVEIGVSPFNTNAAQPKFHFKARYEYLKKYDFGVDHNAPDFYDLFNDRKRGTIGTKWRFGHTQYWVYDNPLKIKQNSEISVYTDYEFINDNLVRVSAPDFFVAQTSVNAGNKRRSIGSSDSEAGQDITGTIMVFGADPKNPQFSTQVSAEVGNSTTWIAPHNIFNMKVYAGYNFKNDNLHQSQFFFGGFGNRALENVDFKQYRSMFRFPGIPIYSLPSIRFIKFFFENNFPPIRFSSASIGQQYLNHIDFSIYTQTLLTKSPYSEKWVDIGGQINLIFKHWFNLESTLSTGIAKAWNEKDSDWQWFVSYKLLRN